MGRSRFQPPYRFTRAHRLSIVDYCLQNPSAKRARKLFYLSTYVSPVYCPSPFVCASSLGNGACAFQRSPLFLSLSPWPPPPQSPLLMSLCVSCTCKSSPPHSSSKPSPVCPSARLHPGQGFSSVCRWPKMGSLAPGLMKIQLVVSFNMKSRIKVWVYFKTWQFLIFLIIFIVLKQ